MVIDAKHRKQCDLLEGNVYLAFPLKDEQVSDFFFDYNGQLSLINMSVDVAIKVYSYFRWKLTSITAAKANKLALLPQRINTHSYAELIFLIIYAEIKRNKVVVVGTVGLDETSILKCAEFSENLLKIFKEKIIILTASNNYIKSDSNGIVTIGNSKESRLRSVYSADINVYLLSRTLVEV